MICLSVIPKAYAFDKEYSRWGEVLENYVSKGLVDYKGLQKSPEVLQAFIDDAKSVTQAEYDNWLTQGKIAFWLNIYNAEVIRTVLGKYPFPTHPLRREGLNLRRFLYSKTSIMQIPDAFKKKSVETLEEKFSLDRIRDKVLRKEFNDPRIHFALVPAALSAPLLREEPYTGAKLDAQLEEQTKKFFENADNFRFDIKENKVALSPIFKWYKKDFKNSGGTLAFIKKYAPSEISGRINDDTGIEWLEYDWTLNQK